jgi:septal ring factor EnvC (AmiA/AmiB activator)
MEKASDSILSLKPVTFHYKADAKNTPCFGLIAEEVADIDPSLVIRDKNGEPWSVRYDQINAMLLNEFLKAHKKIEQQQGSITELKATVAQQQSKFQATTAEQQKQIRNLIAQLKEQAIQIQKVSAQIEMSKPAPNIAASRP